MDFQKDARKCEVCGKRLHKVQTCRKCGKALCNIHLSTSRHDCITTESAEPSTEPRRTSAGTKPRQVPGKVVIAIVLVAVVVVSAVLLLMNENEENEPPGGEEENEPSSGEGEVIEVTPGASFSIELSLSEIMEVMMRSMGDQMPSGSPFGNRTNPFGNGTRPGGFGNGTLPGGLGLLRGAGEFLVAVPESFQVEDPSSTSIEISPIRESRDGYDIYGVKILDLNLTMASSAGDYDPTSRPSIDLNLTASTSTGDYDIYYTILALSGLEPAAFKRVIGKYFIGDLVFLIKERVEVA